MFQANFTKFGVRTSFLGGRHFNTQKQNTGYVRIKTNGTKLSLKTIEVLYRAYEVILKYMSIVLRAIGDFSYRGSPEF